MEADRHAGSSPGPAAEIEELKEAYSGEWLAIEITKEEQFGPVEGKLLHHCRERTDLWKKVHLEKVRRIYITYAGPLVEEGYAVAFLAV